MARRHKADQPNSQCIHELDHSGTYIGNGQMDISKLIARLYPVAHNGWSSKRHNAKLCILVLVCWLDVCELRGLPIKLFM